MNEETKNQVSGILDVLAGDESIKIDVCLDYTSIAVLLGGVVAVGVLLIFINSRLR